MLVHLNVCFKRVTCSHSSCWQSFSHRITLPRWCNSLGSGLKRRCNGFPLEVYKRLICAPLKSLSSRPNTCNLRMWLHLETAYKRTDKNQRRPLAHTLIKCDRCLYKMRLDPYRFQKRLWEHRKKGAVCRSRGGLGESRAARTFTRTQQSPELWEVDVHCLSHPDCAILSHYT